MWPPGDYSRIGAKGIPNTLIQYIGITVLVNSSVVRPFASPLTVCVSVVVLARYETHPMQSVFAGYGRTDVGASRSHHALRAASWLSCGCCSAVASHLVCAPPTLWASPRFAGIGPAGVVPTGGTADGKVYIFTDQIASPVEAFKVTCHKLFHRGLNQ
jgi:hypothetical protein